MCAFHVSSLICHIPISVPALVCMTMKNATWTGFIGPRIFWPICQCSINTVSTKAGWKSGLGFLRRNKPRTEETHGDQRRDAGLFVPVLKDGLCSSSMCPESKLSGSKVLDDPQRLCAGTHVQREPEWFVLLGMGVLSLQGYAYKGSINRNSISWPKLATGWGSIQAEEAKLYIVFTVVSFHKTAKVRATFCQ